MLDESLIVMVGTAPPLEDVIGGAYTERPFDLESFSAYATKNLCFENLAFLREVGMCSVRAMQSCTNKLVNGLERPTL